MRNARYDLNGLTRINSENETKGGNFRAMHFTRLSFLTRISKCQTHIECNHHPPLICHAINRCPHHTFTLISQYPPPELHFLQFSQTSSDPIHKRIRLTLRERHHRIVDRDSRHDDELLRSCFSRLWTFVIRGTEEGGGRERRSGTGSG